MSRQSFVGAGAHQSSVDNVVVGVNVGAEGDKVGVVFMVVLDVVGEGRRCF